jgi:WD40 repeat protein
MSGRQEENEARTFIYDFFRRLNPGLAQLYRDEAFPDDQSSRNLDLTLSTLPPHFFSTLMAANLPDVKFPSIIYNSTRFPPPSTQNRRLALIARHLGKLMLTNRFIGHTRSVRVVYADPARLFFLTVSDDSTMKLWHLPSVSLMFTFKGHQDVITNVAISPDRSLLASVSADHTIRLWSLRDGACLDMISDAALAPFNWVTFSPCGSYLAVASERGRVLIWFTPPAGEASSHPKHPPFLRSVILRAAVRFCCFSPGGNLVAAALDSGSFAVFPVRGNGVLTASIEADHCDSVFFNPNLPTQIFATSSRSNVATMWRLGASLEIVREFNAKSQFKRNSLCQFAVSSDFSLLFCCSSSVLIAWSTSDGRIVLKVEGLPSVIQVLPHVDLVNIVAVLTKSCVLVYDVESSTVVRSLFIPSEAPRMLCGTWDTNGLAFFGGDVGGGFYFFRFSPNITEPICETTEHFFPSDFTPSEWDEDIGQIEERRNQSDRVCLVHLNPRVQLINANFQIMVARYRPHPFDDIICAYFPDAALQCQSDIEQGWVAALAGQEVAAEANDPAHLVLGVGEEAEVDDDSEVTSEADVVKYPIWTTVDHPMKGTFFPQVGQKIVYLREGHVEMLKKEKSLTVRPPLSNDLAWPVWGIFLIQAVHDTRLTCELHLIPLRSMSRGRSSFVKDLSVDAFELITHESARVIEFPIDDAPYFLVSIELFKDSLRIYDGLEIGDDVVVYYRKRGVEIAYPGRVLTKTDSQTRYNSVEIDWGDENSTFLSPWEFYSVNGTPIHRMPRLPQQVVTQIEAAGALLEAAERRFAEVFVTPLYSPDIIYPMDFGLVLRRIRNEFYTAIQTLVFDIEQVEESHRRLGDSLVGVARGIVQKLKKVIEAPDSLAEVMDLSAVDGEEERQMEEHEGAEAEGGRLAEKERGDRRPGNLRDTGRDRNGRERQQSQGEDQDDNGDDFELPMFQIRPRPGPVVDSE